MGSPESIADQGYALALLGLLGGEHAPLERLNPKHRQEVGGNPGADNPFRAVCVREREGNTVKDRHLRKALALTPPFYIPVSRSPFPKILIGNFGPQHCQLLWRSIRKGPEQNRVQDAEHCSIGPDRQRQCGYGSRRKTGTVQERPHRVPDVLRRSLHYGKGPSFTVLFLHRLYGSKAASGGVSRLFRIHAGVEV